MISGEFTYTAFSINIKLSMDRSQVHIVILYRYLRCASGQGQATNRWVDEPPHFRSSFGQGRQQYLDLD